MPTEIILPRVDMDMTTGRIARWYVEEGQPVAKGALLFDIETSKAAMEIEAPVTGILRGRVDSGDAEIPVGEVIGWIVAESEEFDPALLARRPVLVAAATEANIEIEAGPIAIVSVGAGGSSGLTATPLARRLSRERGIELASLKGSGPHGRIQGADVPGQGTAAAIARPHVDLTAANGVNRAWLRNGSGTPTVMLHGFGSELDSWRPLVHAVPAAGPVLAVDLPAHGKSAVLATTTFDAAVAAVAAAIAAEGITAAHLVGHSLGGAVATAIAAGSTVAARSLLLLAPGGLGPEINGGFIAGFLSAGSAESLAPWLHETVADPAKLPRDFISVSMRPRQRDGYLDGLAALANALFPDGKQGFDVRSALNGLAVPRRIIVGRDDRIIPAAHAANLDGAIAIHAYAGVGHMPQLEIASEVARIWLEIVRAST